MPSAQAMDPIEAAERARLGFVSPASIATGMPPGMLSKTWWPRGIEAKSVMGVWTQNDRRMDFSHTFVCAVKAGLKAKGWSPDNPKAVALIIHELREKDPAYTTYTEDNLRVQYYRALRLPPPLPTEEDRRRARLMRWRKNKDRWVSVVTQWGKETKRLPAFITAKQARQIVNRLIAVTPPHRRADLDQVFNHMSIHRTDREKIKWLQSGIAKLEKNPNYWFVPISRRGRPDVTAGRIGTYLADAPEKRAHKCDIAAALGIPKTTAQTTLCSMARADWVIPLGNGVYGLPMKGVNAYVPTQKATLDALGKGNQRTCAELMAETGKSEGAVHLVLHRLHNAGTIVRTGRGRYAPAGSAPPHVYARDAISDALGSGKKTMTMPEFIAATGKNYGEIWQALRREEAKGHVKQVAHRGKPLAWQLSRSPA
jgi:hypothetical protein